MMNDVIHEDVLISPHRFTVPGRPRRENNFCKVTRNEKTGGARAGRRMKTSFCARVCLSVCVIVCGWDRMWDGGWRVEGGGAGVCFEAFLFFSPDTWEVSGDMKGGKIRIKG